MENLDKLPLPLLIAFGLGLAVIFGVRHLGLLSGERSTPAGATSTAQVAAVIVDPSALNRATAALEAQTMESINGRKSFERGLESLCRSVERLCEEVDDLKKELIRRGR
jgi:hypothetical protein